ncbi:MAG: SIS domain-containing protein [Clostridiales Family XIII bacterium]|nr:SIS domain-containing protein [Clostridiales Family XIII bacterium]
MNGLRGRRIHHVCFVSCGGSSALMYPCKYYLDREAGNLASDVYNSNEFIHRNPANVNENTVVILCSQEGRTPETVEACRFARKKGAVTVSLAMVEGSPLEAETEFFIRYGHYETSDPINTSYGVMYLLGAALVELTGNASPLDKMSENLIALAKVTERTKFRAEQDSLAFAKSCKDDGVIYALGAGPDYSQCYVFCNCYLMEMQWINAIPIHAGEFFHGPFEIIEKNSPVVLLLGLGATRPIEERARRFCEKYTDRIFLLDAAHYDFEGVDANHQGYLAPLVFNAVLRRYSKAIAEERDHPLDTRRYMHIVAY